MCLLAPQRLKYYQSAWILADHSSSKKFQKKIDFSLRQTETAFQNYNLFRILAQFKNWIWYTKIAEEIN